MAITLFGGHKGGTGKSTLATNFSVYLARSGRDVLLVDTDRQGSADGWVAIRPVGLPRVASVQKFADVAAAVRDLRGRYDEIIIDAGGRDSRELRSALLVAEVCVVPVKASQFDLWTLEQVDRTVDDARGFNPDLKSRAIISMAPTHPGIREADEARELLADFPNLQLTRAVIRERKVYRDASAAGRGVLELDNVKAALEFEALGEEVLHVI